MQELGRSTAPQPDSSSPATEEKVKNSQTQASPPLPFESGANRVSRRPHLRLRRLHDWLITSQSSANPSSTSCASWPAR